MSMSQYRGRHRRASKAKPTIAASVSTAFILGAFASASPADAATANDFARLRQCESGGNYRINTGNGYYGAYQFDLSTWRSIGYDGYPHLASPATQDAAARRLQSMRGWSPWPACSRMLGLGSGGGGSDSGGSSDGGSSESAPAPAPKQQPHTHTHTHTHDEPAPAPAPAPKPEPRIPVLADGTVLKAPKAPGRAFELTTKGAPRADVKRWQLQMARRGWDIEVDGYFGAESQRLAKKFAAQKRLGASAQRLERAVERLAERRAEGQPTTTAEKRLVANLKRMGVSRHELNDKQFTWTYVVWRATWESPVAH